MTDVLRRRWGIVLDVLRRSLQSCLFWVEKEQTPPERFGLRFDSGIIELFPFAVELGDWAGRAADVWAEGHPLWAAFDVGRRGDVDVPLGDACGRWHAARGRGRQTGGSCLALDPSGGRE